MLDVLALPFFQRALITGLILGSLMAFLGVIIVLRRMAFFSDAIGHAALTGIAIGLLLNINPFLSALIFSLLIAIGIANLQRRSQLPLDTILGVFFSASVALGVILVQLTPGYQADLISFLFGNILTVSNLDVVLTLIMTVIVSLVLLLTGKTFIAIALDQQLAQAEGVNVAFHETLLLLTLAGVIALAIKFVGIILVTAMVIIPAATALNLARSLTAMFIASLIAGNLAVIIGMTASAAFNIASGPAIVLAATTFFVISLFIKPLFKTT